MKPPRIIFMGTPDFAVGVLETIISNGFDVAAVVTAPDKPSGRGLALQASSVKQFALAHHLPVLQPEKLKDADFVEQLQDLKADVFVVVAFRMLPEVVWAMPPRGTFNLHASLLPQYRGAAPIHHAVINGETETGVTTFFIEHQIDTGSIILQEKCPIGANETTGELHDKLMNIGALLVVKTLELIATGEISTVPQSSIAAEELKPAPKIFKEFCEINWHRPGLEIHNHIRGLSPFPGAFTSIADTTGTSTQLKIYQTSFVPQTGLTFSGKLLTDGKSYLHIPVSGGMVAVRSLQMAGKKRLPVVDFLRGFPALSEYTIGSAKA